MTPLELLPLLAVLVLIAVVIGLVESARNRHQQKVIRAILKAREQVEADRVHEQLYRMYQHTMKEVDRF
jgi:hypothetical protein